MNTKVWFGRGLGLLSALWALSSWADAPAATVTQGARKIDVDEAVKLALQSSPQLKAAQYRVEGFEAQKHSIRGRMLPLINLNDEWLHYKNAFIPSINFPGSPEPISFPIHNINTNTFVADFNQPVLQLFRLFEDHQAADSQSLAALAAERQGERGVRQAIQTGYLRYFESVAAVDIGNASVAQLEDEKSNTQARVNAGSGTNADLLRVEVARANARQQVLVAQTNAMVAKAALLIALGFDENERGIELVEPELLERAKNLAVSAEEAQKLASERREEVTSAIYTAKSAHQTANSRRWALLPDFNVEGAYVNINGQVLAEHESFYIGVKANWNVWEWGATWYAADSARAQANAAQEQVEDTKRTVRLDAATKVAQLENAVTAVDVAQTAIASAEEAFRVTEALLKAGSATTTDVLDSQAALTQAKLNLVRARYERAIANVGVEQAIATPLPGSNNTN